MALQQAEGASLGVSATLPATHTLADFGALTFTPVGKLNGLPDLDGKRDVSTFDDLTTSEEEKFAGMWRAGNGTATVGLDEASAGQTILETAKTTGDKVAIAITLRSGSIYYRQAIVTSFMPTGIAVGGIVMAEVGFEFEKTTIKDAA